MRIQLRRNLSLDSPGPSATVTSANGPDIGNPTPPPTEPNPNEPPVPPVVVPPVTPPAVDPNAPDPNTQNTNNEPPAEPTVFEAIHEHIGFEGVDLSKYEDSVPGLVEYVKDVIPLAEQKAVEKEYQELAEVAPNALELAKWERANPGRSVAEYYASKMEKPSIDVASLDDASNDTLLDIIYKDLLSKGMPEKQARGFAQASVDSNSAVEDAKAIVEANNARAAEDRARKEEDMRREQENNYKAHVAEIERQIGVVKQGKVGNIIIPAAEQQAFIDANYMDARDPRYPGLSAVDIMLQEMSPEQRIELRYLVHKKLNINSIVQARATTATLSGMLGKGKNTSNMNGTAQRTEVQTSNRLDSPNSN